MMPFRALVFALFVLAAVPVSADQWYEHYARAERALMDADHATAIAELNMAIERRGDSGARVRTYGMRVIDYFPYLKLGIAYFAAGQFEAALRAFETEEQLGAVEGSEPAWGELNRFKRRATDALENQRAEQRQAVRNLVDENLTRAREHQSAGRLDEAVAAVDRALALAPEDPDAVRMAAALREELARLDDERSRRERVAQLMDEGQRLRADGRLVEAAARFRRALDLAPESAAGPLLAEVQAELCLLYTSDAADDSVLV